MQIITENDGIENIEKCNQKTVWIVNKSLCELRSVCVYGGL